MIRFHHMIRADGFGTLYDFESAGDSLPRHYHAPEDEHSVTVIEGSVVVVEEASETRVAAGQTLKFDSSKMHHVMALEPHTLTFHPYVHGKPSWADGLPLEERTGRL